MKLQQIVEIVFILDRSGSMVGLETDTIGGFNSMIQKHKNKDIKAYVSTILFDHEALVLHDRLPLEEVPQMTEREYAPRGSTALLDAVGSAIKHIRTVHKYARYEDCPSKTIFIITTDGLENASKHYTLNQVKNMIELQKARYDWEFIFLGANIDAVKTARTIGIDEDRAVRYKNDKIGTKIMYNSLADTICRCCNREELLDKSWKKEIEEDYTRRNTGNH